MEMIIVLSVKIIYRNFNKEVYAKLFNPRMENIKVYYHTMLLKLCVMNIHFQSMLKIYIFIHIFI